MWRVLNTMRVNLLRKLKYSYKAIPTALTLGNSLCGFGAILYTLHAFAPEKGENIPELLAVSAWCIIGAMMFDMLDGWTARTLNVHSQYGVEMDSLADMVTFGVAPAVIVAVMARTNQFTWLPYHWVWVFSAIYLGCTAFRLALYNVKARNNESGESFHGLPSPGGAAAVCSIIILYGHPDFRSYIIIAEILPYYAAVLGILMISNIPYAHMGHWLGSKRKNKLKIFFLIIFFTLFARTPHIVAACAINIYILSGPVYLFIRRYLLKNQNVTHLANAVSSS